jgi:hypothetical protein
LAEEFEVAANIKDFEVLLGFAETEEVWAESGAAPTICQNFVFERTSLKNTRLTNRRWILSR